MTGGMGYLYDPDDLASDMMNRETVVTVAVNEGHYMDELKGLIEMHLAETGSRRAAAILQHWDDEKGKFIQVAPKEMLNKLTVPIEGLELAVPAE